MCRHVPGCKRFAKPVAEGARIPCAVPMYMHESTQPGALCVKESSSPWACGRFKPYQDRKRAPHFSQETEFEHATAAKWTTALNDTGQDRLGLRQTGIAVAGTCHTGVCAALPPRSTLLSQ
jgi:hypothetical protein